MTVKAWEEQIHIPTYKISQPEKNPMFLEKRIYQGSSGAVYPYQVIDQVYDEKEDKSYRAVFLENEYLKIMILPELGGRVQMAYDKTNDYHFVYYNQVIKPALVGLTGPWISGGIEFNWPQHHRPSTFDPVDFSIEENADGSCTVWVSEIEKMFHTKGMAGFTLHPDKAYLEITGKLYNRTDLPQTFLWWANPAVAVDEHYQSVFPPDVQAVYDHGKRDVSLFPIAKGTYYKKDYAPGTDISWYKNIPVPTSFMAVGSDFDFVGGYHHQKQAGMLHVANHHVSPGKKQWTWGHSHFGQMWDKHLTDVDGPYIEIMTGVFTDNQPDFSWIMANQEITFTQFFMPYKNIGYVKNASKDALVNLVFNDGIADISVYTTAIFNDLNVTLSLKGKIIFKNIADISPKLTYHKRVPLPKPYHEKDIEVIVTNAKGEELIRYKPVELKQTEVSPEPAKPILQPEEIQTNEALYLAGAHLEQYRHATYNPVEYYQEALRRDKTDWRNNNALGLWYLRRGRFVIAEKYLKNAFETTVKHNPNPYNSEPIYNLGLCLLYQDKVDEAYQKFYKSTWSVSLQDTAFLQIARIDGQKGNWLLALEHIDKSINRNTRGFKARHFKLIALRQLKHYNLAIAFAKETLALDAFDFGSLFEIILCYNLINNPHQSGNFQAILVERMRDNVHSYIEIALDYVAVKLYENAIELLSLCCNKENQPLYAYYIAYFYQQLGDTEKANNWLQKGFLQGPDGIFPNRLEDIKVLNFVTTENPKDYKAYYYLGNLWYDKRQYPQAIDAWEKSHKQNPSFASVNRNLGLAYFNKGNDASKALAAMEQAFFCDTTDARVLFELDQLYQRLNCPLAKRLNLLESHKSLLDKRDDLYLAYVTIKNLTEQFEEAITLLNRRRFHPWEGGEGKIIKQYLFANLSLAIQYIQVEKYQHAIDILLAMEHYPENLGEGKLYGTKENDRLFWLGVAYQNLGDEKEAKHYFDLAAEGNLAPTQAIFYNDTPPDLLLYQGLAMQRLGMADTAKNKFDTLIEYGENHLEDDVKIDFFAVSLPDLLIFEDDLNTKNKIHCYYMMALGNIGLNNLEKANLYFEQIRDLDQNHLGLNFYSAHQQSLFNQTLQC